MIAGALCLLSLGSALVAAFFAAASAASHRQAARVADALTRNAREAEGMRAAVTAAAAKQTAGRN